MTSKALWVLVLVFALGGVAVADGKLALRVKTVHVGDGSRVADAVILIEDGKLKALGAGVAIPSGFEEQRFDAAEVTPGLVDANAVAGMPSPDSWNEQSCEVIPQMHVLDTLDLRSRDFDRLARTGVTCVYVGGDGGSVIGPRGAVLKTAGTPVKQRVLLAESALKATMGREPEWRGSQNNSPTRFFANTFTVRRPTTRMGTVWVFRKAFYKALAQLDQSPLHGDPALMGDPATGEADAIAVLARVVRGEVPLRIQARAINDIEAAIRLAREFKLKFTLEEGLEAYRVLDLIKGEGVPVIYGPMYIEASGPRAFADDADKPCLTTPALLAQAGIPFALSAVDLAPQQDLRQQAIFAVRYGLAEDVALKAITSVPAGMLGVGARLGSLKAGMDADLVVWSGPVFSLETRPLLVIVNGQVTYSQAQANG